MTAYLKYISQGSEQKVACDGVTSIGRDGGNDVVLSDLLVSRHHAMIRRLGKADYYLIDSGSSNGSRVNNRRITVPTLLGNADQITIGETTLVFESEPQQPSFTDSLSMQATVIMDEPVIKEVTLLVADIRGFTRLSERLPIRTLTRLMNQWFEQVSEAIVKNQGEVDKFIGDCVFARWESESSRNNVISALRTACDLRDITAALPDVFPEVSEPLFIGVGINTGMASIGVGSENTVLGDAVNIAFRLESATRELGTDVVLSESAYRSLPEYSWDDSERLLKLKGKQKAVKVVDFDFARVETLLHRIMSD